MEVGKVRSLNPHGITPKEFIAQVKSEYEGLYTVAAADGTQIKMRIVVDLTTAPPGLGDSRLVSNHPGFTDNPIIASFSRNGGGAQIGTIAFGFRDPFRNTLAHEFGHALGFVNANDNPGGLMSPYQIGRTFNSNGREAQWIWDAYSRF